MDKIIDKVVEKQRGRDNRTPLHPDPLWPVGAPPLHLSMEQRAAAIEIGAFVELKGEEWHCSKCNTVDKPSKEKPEMCTDCAILDAKQTALSRKTNSTWMETASEFGLELFERQPEESDTDWRIWVTYRSYYPGKLPTYTALAEEASCATGTVVNASQRWNYKIRILAWARFCDAGSQQERVERVREMNDKQLNLSARMLEKVSEAVDLIQPNQLRPGEIASLFKRATDLERKAVMLVDEVIEQPAMQDKTATAKTLTKLEDIQEIAAILKKAGALEGKDIAVETSTRIIVRGGDND